MRKTRSERETKSFPPIFPAEISLGIRHLAAARSDIGETRRQLGWNHIRVGVVVPIGVIVAVAILCGVVPVLSSAQQADEVAPDTHRHLFPRPPPHPPHPLPP